MIATQTTFIFTPHPEAVKFFSAFRYFDGTCINERKLVEYTNAANVLHSLDMMLQDGRKNKAAIIDSAIAFIVENGIKLPKNADRLGRDLSAYRKKGFDSVINGRDRNANAAKAKNEALIRQLAARPNNFKATVTTFDYNSAALQQQLPTLSRRTILNLTKASEWQILGSKQGKHAWRNSYDVVVGRERPPHPLLLTVHDGFDWELYYQAPVTKMVNGKPKTAIRYHNRKNVVVVVDAFNDYPLGYAIGESENIELMAQALRNAMLHVAELTGGYHFPFQLKSDNFALSKAGNAPNTLRSLFENIAPHVTPAQIGNARDKTIESWFSRFNQAYTSGAADARRGLPQRINYSGLNADSLKKNQPNRDFLDNYKKNFPDEQGVILQIVNDIEADRATKREAWLTAWANTPANLKRPISRYHYLETFGEKRDRTIQITNKGIVMTHRGQKHTFLMLEKDFIQSVGADCTIYFDEATPESILAYDQKHNKKYLVDAFRNVPMDYMSMKEGDRAYLNKVIQFKKDFEQAAIEANTEDMTRIEADGLLKTYFTYNGGNKALIAEAKRALNEGSATALNTRNTPPSDNLEEEFEAVYVTKGSLKPISKPL